jgi:hypothetical protein
MIQHQSVYVVLKLSIQDISTDGALVCSVLMLLRGRGSSSMQLVTSEVAILRPPLQASPSEEYGRQDLFCNISTFMALLAPLFRYDV